MKIAVDIGHNTNADGGATGILNENICAMAVGTLLIQKLIKAGHQVSDVLPRGKITSLQESLKARTDKANDFGAEVYVSVHFNAGNGQGTEICYKSDKGKALGTPVLNEVVKAIGTKVFNGGFDHRDNLYVLNQTNMPAFIIECLFVDTQSDCDKYNPEKIAEAIFKGITGKASITPAPTPVSAERVTNLMQDVKNFQMSLNTCGFTNANGAKLDVDGFVGENTIAATKKMQTFIDTNIIKKKV